VKEIKIIMAGLKPCQIRAVSIQTTKQSQLCVLFIFVSVYLGGTSFGLMPPFQLICNRTFLRCEFFKFHFQNLNIHTDLQLYIALSLIS
jgi:hypothetical protein